MLPVCADALQFMEKDQGQYDLIIIDVFNGREVPHYVTTAAFTQLCRRRLSPHGSLVLNYMITQGWRGYKSKSRTGTAFLQVREIAFHLNRVYVATA